LTGEAPIGHGAALRGWARMAAVGAIALALDQATKAVVRGSVERGGEVELALGIQIVNVRNRGIAFGLFEDGGALLVVVTVATLAILVGWFAADPSRRGLWLAIGLLAGGAIGNLIDRLREREVTDFLDLPGWPAFNVADVAITAGVVALILYALTSDRPESERSAAER
jgi:signal peptidase II